MKYTKEMLMDARNIDSIYELYYKHFKVIEKWCNAKIIKPSILEEKGFVERVGKLKSDSESRLLNICAKYNYKIEFSNETPLNLIECKEYLETICKLVFNLPYKLKLPGLVLGWFTYRQFFLLLGVATIAAILISNLW